jgi:hypothetical protein
MSIAGCSSREQGNLLNQRWEGEGISRRFGLVPRTLKLRSVSVSITGDAKPYGGIDLAAPTTPLVAIDEATLSGCP